MDTGRSDEAMQPCTHIVSVAGQPLTQFLLLNGPNGAISHFCTSRALQSLRRTRPNMWSSAFSTLVDVPISFPGPTNAPWGSVDVLMISHKALFSSARICEQDSNSFRKIGDKHIFAGYFGACLHVRCQHGSPSLARSPGLGKESTQVVHRPCHPSRPGPCAAADPGTTPLLRSPT